MTEDAAIRIDLILCRVCALYPHYGALPPSSTLELVPQEPRNSYHRSGLGLLQRDRSTACLPYRITLHPILGSPVSSRHRPPSWPTTCSQMGNIVPNGDSTLSQTGTARNNKTGFQGYRRLPGQGNRARIASPLW